METAEMVLEKMEMLDQQIAAALSIADQRPDVVERVGVDLAAFRVIRPATASRARMDPTIMLRRRSSQIEPSKSHNETAIQ
jgi:hypothetical protein